MSKLIALLFIIVAGVQGFVVKVPSSSGDVTVDYDIISMSGEGTALVGKFSLTNGVGTVEFNKKLYTGIVYQFQNWTEQEVYIYDVIAIADDFSDLAVFYFYGNDPFKLFGVWYETLFVIMDYEAATGNVSPIFNKLTNETAKFPALHTTYKGISTKIEISGDYIHYKEGSGAMIVNGTKYDIQPFNVVDCTWCDDKGGWYEIHSLFSPKEDSTCFGILYMIAHHRNSVELAYGFCFPRLKTLSATFDAKWSGKL